MKRTLALTLAAALLWALCACGGPDAEDTSFAADTAPVEAGTEPVQTLAPLPGPSQQPSANPSAEPSEEPSAQPSDELCGLPLAPSPDPTQAPATPGPTPTPAPAPSPEPTPEPVPTPAAGVDLAAFYADVTDQYEFAFMMEADDTTLDQMFAGLSSLNLAQRMVYICGMMPSPNGDFALIQVSDSKDAAAVKSILQARIDYMVGDGNGPGGAFYPMEATMWEENARIAANGDYVMLIVHKNCDDIVSQFNALF